MKNYKFFTDICLSQFSDWDLFKLGSNSYGLGENLFDIRTSWESPVYYDKARYIAERKEEAESYLKSAMQITVEELADHNDTLEQDVLRACDSAWFDSVESAVYDLYQEKVKDPGFEYSAFEYLDGKGNVTEYLYEADQIRYYFSVKLWRKEIHDPTYYDTIKDAMEEADDDIATYCADNLEVLTTGSHGDFDLAQNWADCDQWLDMFKDYNETEQEVRAERKARQANIKLMIKNRAPLECRV